LCIYAIDENGKKLDTFKPIVDGTFEYHFQGGALILSGQRKIKEGKEIRATERA
jgi:hypothetical protein